MKNIKTIIVTFIITGSVFTGLSVYSANNSFVVPQQAMIDYLQNKKNQTVPKVETVKKEETKKQKTIKTTVPKMTVEERLAQIEKRLDALESK